VNRRIAAHKNRKGLSVVDEDAPAEGQGGSGSRAAAAAARVAARYAKAPSYSELQAAEARGALRAAEAAARAALEVQVAAQAALAWIESADEVEAEGHAYTDGSITDSTHREVRQLSEDAELDYAENRDFEIRWEPDMPAMPAVSSHQSATEVQDDWRDSEPNSNHSSYTYDAVEAAQPIHANLIEFPRELVATRRMRPRLTEANSGAATDEYGQLSIFEVDPSSVSTYPGMPQASSATPSPSWSGPEWSAIRLDGQAMLEPEYRGEPETKCKAASIHLAPFGLRLMATVVDAALVAGTVCGMAVFAASQFHHLPSQKVTEFCAFAAMIVIGVAYHVTFLRLAKATPGMRYAQLSLCTFDDEIPSREQVTERLKAMALSLLPVGLGLVWAVFDEDSMSWHDRHSRTYLRQS
jgi:hypothetical protein